MTIELTNNEMNMLANALEFKIRDLESAVKLDFTPDTKKELRQMFRKSLKNAIKLRSKIKFVRMDK